MNKMTADGKIWIVRGSTGQYSDYHSWIVIAYFDKEKAEEHAAKAQKRAEKIFKDCGGEHYNSNAKNKYDPHFSMDYTGTHYSVSKVTLSK